MKAPLVFYFFFTCCSVALNGQTLNTPGNGDSLYPVTERYQQYNNPFASIQNTGKSTIHSIVNDSGRYYLAGTFSSFTENSGTVLLYDTTTKEIINNRKWRINGRVNAVVPDGQGGFFIGGNFTSIGDSSRSYIAHITNTGKPTAWKVSCNGEVKAIVKRNDTLFIGGAFKLFAGSSRNCFAMHSATTSTLFANGGAGIFNYMEVINSIVLQKDTIIYGGTTSGLASDYNHLRKYCFKLNYFLPFLLPAHDYRDIKDICLSADSSLLIFRYSSVDGNAIRAVDNKTGGLRYKIFTNAAVSNSDYGAIHDIELVGKKCYVAGDFARVNYTNFYRKGYFVFDVATGALLPDNLYLNNFASSVQHKNGKLYLSGRFTSINSIARHNFAVTDTGSYLIDSFQLSPSDALMSITFQNNIALLAGDMTGIHAVKRFGLAAIDSATRAVTNWNASYPSMPVTIRMMVKGDSLFLLTSEDRYYQCYVNFPSTFKIYSLRTGLEYALNQLPPQNVNDFYVDGNYMYVSYKSSLRRYSLPQLIRDNSWGTTWVSNPNSYEHSLNHIMVEGNNIYTVGDAKYYFCSSTIIPRYAYLDVYSKVTGQVINSYRYAGTDLYYDQPKFHRAVIANNKMYIQGQFTQLNGAARKNFASVNLSNGTLTAWQPVIPTSYVTSFNHTSALKHYNGKIWFGSNVQYMTDSSIFSGFGGIDTATGLVVQPFKTSAYNSSIYYESIDDFIISAKEVVLVGSFDSINGRPFKSIAIFPLTGIDKISVCNGGSRTLTSNLEGNTYQWQVDDGNGFANITDNLNFAGSQTKHLQLSNLPSSWYGYKFRSIVNNNLYSDVFELKFYSLWTGAINNDWFTAGNWNCGVIPDAFTDVTINQGTVLVNANATIRSITTNPNVTLRIMQGNTLTVLK